MKLYIKYMVSLRCKMLVREELKKLDIAYLNIDLGLVDIPNDIRPEQYKQLQENLHRSGLELLDDKKHILIEKIKGVIIEMIHYADALPEMKYSIYISDKLNLDYTYLSNLFSEVKGMSIQQYIILHKIEKIKELIIYDEMNFSEIASRLQYSSVAHLSHQFKKITGLTPSFFKALKDKKRSSLENL